MLRRISGPKSEKNEWIIRTKKINSGIYVNKDQDVLVRICSKTNDDKMVKNFFFKFLQEKM